MASAGRRAKVLESAISICLLALLFVTGVGIFIKQYNSDMSRFGIGTVTTVQPLQELQVISEEKPDLSSFVPAEFESLSETEVYQPVTLYEKINGKAPLYIEAGFEELSTKRFVDKNDESLWMELFVYDMGNVRNAFSVYSIQRRADADILSLFHTSFGYRTSNALYFVHSNYYVELVGSSESDELFKALIEVAQKIRSDLPVDDKTRIAELGFFPTENLVLESIKLYLANAFGFEGLTDTFTAKYNIEGETVTAFLSKRSEPKDAKMVVENYYNFLIDNGGVVKQAVNKVFEGKVMDFYGTTEIVFAVGQFVAGVHEAENQQAAEKAADILTNKLNNVMSNE
ncbi:MAG: hypothetical protein JSV82_03760 [Planctomycetota bacterium]|nr:MAG: hypothetical protein JSV82_03760 [Planctomycetota bacterium]